MHQIKGIIKNSLLCILLVILSSVTVARPRINHYKADNLFLKYANHYFDGFYFPNNPTLAAEMGIHVYDNQLEDYSRAGIEKKIETLKDFEWNLNSFSPLQLSEQVKGDRELVLNNVRSQLLTLQTIRPWEKDPDYYSSGVAAGAFVIMERNYAPAAVRLRALIAREKLMPQVLREARTNLVNPPHIYTQIALEQLPDIINFFRKDLPQAFSSVNDPALRKAFTASNDKVVQALHDYQSWLEDEVLPDSHGDYRIGAVTFHKKLQYDEMVDTPLDKLLEIGMIDLHKNQQAFVRIAHEINPYISPREVLAELTATHPAPDKLLKKFADSLDNLSKFIQDKKIITIPANTRPSLNETPAFMRATTFASMDTPGPFEAGSKQSFFNVTLPNPAWKKAEVEDFMKSYTYPTIVSTAIHEVYPGHYMQYLWTNRIHDRVRKILGANTNVEGWAHYTEQMMYDQGYGTPGYGAKNQRQAKLMRMGQLLDALLRDARFIVGIKMHTGQMSFNQAVDFFVKEGYQPRMLGTVEAKRATSDPTYLYYTLGKLQILKLRNDVAAKEGSAFSLQKFHDEFMLQGWPPIKIVRRAMLHDDSPTL